MNAANVITIDEHRGAEAERSQGRPGHGRIRHDPRAHCRCRDWRCSGHGKYHSEQLLEPDRELRQQWSNALPNLLHASPLQLRPPLRSQGWHPTERAYHEGVTSKEVTHGTGTDHLDNLGHERTNEGNDPVSYGSPDQADQR